MKINKIAVSQGELFTRHDEIGAAVKMEWNAQKVGKMAVAAWFADAVGLEKGTPERAELVAHWMETPGWFGVNISAGKNARAGKAAVAKELTDYSGV
jgi:hypothetical protein